MPYAVFVDLENVGVACLRDVFGRLERQEGFNGFGIKRAYADWKIQSSRTRKIVCELDIHPVAVESGKNAADFRLIADALQFADCFPEIESYALLSGDHSLARLAVKLRSDFRKKVVLYSHVDSTSHALKEACEVFIPVRTSRRSRGRSQSPLSLDKPAGPDIKATTTIGRFEPRDKRQYILEVLRNRPGCTTNMRHQGLSITQLAEALTPLRDPAASKKRWLKKLLLSACCENADVCLAQSLSGGHLMLFLRDRVPDGYVILNNA